MNTSALHGRILKDYLAAVPAHPMLLRSSCQRVQVTFFISPLDYRIAIPMLIRLGLRCYRKAGPELQPMGSPEVLFGLTPTKDFGDP